MNSGYYGKAEKRLWTRGRETTYNALISTLGGSLSASFDCEAVPPPCCRELSPPTTDSEMNGTKVTDKNARSEDVAPVVWESALHVLGIDRAEPVLDTLLDIHLSLKVTILIESNVQLIVRIVQREKMGSISHRHDGTASPQDVLRKKQA